MERKTPAVKSLNKALAILDFIGESSNPRVASEIASGVDMNISSTYKILSTLVDADYLIFDKASKQYHLSSKFIRYSGKLREGQSVSKVARPYMLEMAEQTHETIHCGIVEGFYGVFLEKVNSSQVVGVQTRVGTKYPLNTGATQKAMMAFLSEEKFEDFCQNYLDDGTEEGKVKVREAKEQRVIIQKQGYSVTSEEVNPNVSAIAAPIFGYCNKLVGSLAIAGPCNRFSEEAIAKYILLVIENAKRISKELGATL